VFPFPRIFSIVLVVSTFAVIFSLSFSPEGIGRFFPIVSLRLPCLSFPGSLTSSPACSLHHVARISFPASRPLLRPTLRSKEARPPPFKVFLLPFLLRFERAVLSSVDRTEDPQADFLANGLWPFISPPSKDYEALSFSPKASLGGPSPWTVFCVHGFFTISYTQAAHAGIWKTTYPMSERRAVPETSPSPDERNVSPPRSRSRVRTPIVPSPLVLFSRCLSPSLEETSPFLRVHPFSRSLHLLRSDGAVPPQEQFPQHSFFDKAIDSFLRFSLAG